MDANDPMISKIRNLLKKAQSVAGTPEADQYNEKAAELIAKYGVDQALLAAEGKIDDPIVSEHVAIADTYAVDLRTLIFNITTALGGQMVYLKRRRPGTAQSYTYTAHIFGHRSTLDRAIFLFDLIQGQMLTGAAIAQAPSWENVRSFRKSWMSGFTAAIRDRLSRNEEQAVVDFDNAKAIESDSDDLTLDRFLGESSGSMSMALVVLDRASAVEDRFRIAYPKSAVTKSYRSLRGSGRSKGYVAGQRANIGNSVGGGRKALVG
jgi:hypothetical protein